MITKNDKAMYNNNQRQTRNEITIEKAVGIQKACMVSQFWKVENNGSFTN